MKSNFAKDEMQSLIQQTLDFQNYQVTYESLKIYQKTFGTDDNMFLRTTRFFNLPQLPQ